MQSAAMGRGFETKPTQHIEYIDERGKSVSARSGSKLPFLERSQLAFEVGDAQVGGGEFARAVEQVLLQHPQAMRGVAESVDLLAQPVDFAGPAVLVGFLAVLGETGAFERGRQFGLQLDDVHGEGREWIRGSCGRWVGRLVEQAIDAADAARCAVADLQCLAQAGAGEDGVLRAQFLDQMNDRGVRQTGRAGHGPEFI
jgi:hypothetical protein